MVFLVSYDLRKPGRDYSELIKEIKKSKGWWHYLKSTWIVSTAETSDELYERLKLHLHKNDRILVIEIADDASRQGWLPKKAWDWLRRHIGS